MASIELTQDNFDEIITNNEIVLIDFWATWCGPCQTFGPIFEETSEKYPDAIFAKVNTEDQQEIAGHFQIRSIPTLMIFREQIIVFSQAGALPASGLEQVIDKVKDLDMADVRKQIESQMADQQQEG
ncbi:thioredoxin [Solemya pervernicosa gill symbiont]|uniref:Thioredoxin n=2 Tax=Gammaproteobacteria incertae sedis TaxID=118884 RepID=A0A1T2L7N9_9GAMM|nr:thioredoxin [Candidatus Reidiella endopervernicosa]OOZ41125.1 thioredoxin [Solemya pervernicosa gill symbiont]QKQ26294.1 thioredoxin [Candidatus Reidiella endopervernicosa]